MTQNDWEYIGRELKNSGSDDFSCQWTTDWMTSKVFSEMEEVIKITIRKINEINRSDDANGKLCTNKGEWHKAYRVAKYFDLRLLCVPLILIVASCYTINSCHRKELSSDTDLPIQFARNFVTPE